MTKTYPEFLEEVAKEIGYHNYMDLYGSCSPISLILHNTEAAKRYSIQNQEATRAACSDNATARSGRDRYGAPEAYVDYDSILNTEIITP